MPRVHAAGALSRHNHTVNSSGMGCSEGAQARYDAATMRLRSHSAAALLGTLAVLSAPLAARGEQAPAASAPPISLTVTRAVGIEGLALAGNAPPSQPLEAAIYARFSQDLPTVLLGRYPLASDAAGHYAATVPTAPAFFRNAVVLVIVRSPATPAFAQASALVAAPNVPAPPDSLPASMR